MSVTRLVHWNQVIDKLQSIKDDHNGKKLVVLEFMAPWSEPYVFMKQPLKEIAEQFAATAEFYELDVDKMKDITTKLRVEALPTFLLVKGFTVVERVVGVNKEQLRTAVGKYVAS